MFLGNWLKVTLPEQGVGPDDLQRCQPISVTLWFCDCSTANTGGSHRLVL